MFIAVPTGVKIFNWIATIWGGKLRFTAAMCFAVALVSQFTIGGLSGVTHSVSPADTQQTDTYYIVAHFHYVLFGGSLFGVFAGFYFWWPKIFGRFLSERLGKIHFWLWFVGFNLTFGPMHVLGLQGQPRRTATYGADMGWDFMNLLATIGAFIIAIGFLVFIYNAIASRKNVLHDPDPWDARTIEWATSSPPPAHNFDVEPTTTHLDEWWVRKYETDDRGKLRRRDKIEYLADPDFDASGVHLPSPSYWPIIVAAGLPLIAYGLIYTYWLAALGALFEVVGLFGWAFEPSVDPDAGHGHDDHPSHDDGPAHEEAEAEAVPAGVGAEES
jgi:cytochrome c oxidase subunit 1